MTHDELARDLANHLRAERRMVWCDIQLGPSGSPRPDVYAVFKSFTRPHPHAYECKVSTSDFRGDVSSGKWQEYLRYAVAVYFAAPAGLVTKADVPASCGLIVRHESGTWRTAKRATLQLPHAIPTEALLKLLIDGVEREGPSYRQRRSADTATRGVLRDLGRDVADYLRDSAGARAKARLLVESAERDAAHIERAAQENSERRARADAEAHHVLADLRAALGLDAEASVWACRDAVAAIRAAQKEHPAEHKLRRLVEGLRGQLDWVEGNQTSLRRTASTGG